MVIVAVNSLVEAECWRPRVQIPAPQPHDEIPDYPSRKLKSPSRPGDAGNVFVSSSESKVVTVSPIKFRSGCILTERPVRQPQLWRQLNVASFRDPEQCKRLLSGTVDYGIVPVVSHHV